MPSSGTNPGPPVGWTANYWMIPSAFSQGEPPKYQRDESRVSTWESAKDTLLLPL